MVDWLNIIRDILNRSDKSQIGLGKLCKRGAKQANAVEVQELKKKTLRAQLRAYVEKASASGELTLDNGYVSLPLKANKAALPKQQTPVEEPPSKKQKTSQHAAIPISHPQTETSKGKDRKKAKKRMQPLEDAAQEPVPESQPTGAKEPLDSEPEVTKHPAKTGKKKRKAGAGEKQPGETNASTKGKEHADGAMGSHDAFGREDGADGDETWREAQKVVTMKHGSYSQAEKKAILDAVRQYEEDKGLGHDHKWLFEKKQSAVHGAFKDVARAACPDRTVRSVYMCMTRLLHPWNFKGKWTVGEDGHLLELHEQFGAKWTKIAEQMERMPGACRDRFREISSISAERKKGQWTEEELARLHTAVESFLQTRKEASEQMTATLSSQDMLAEDGVPGSPQKHNVALLDDIDWGWVAQQVRTRTRSLCMARWYNKESPSMISRGEWGVGDDRRLIKGILRGNFTQFYQVPWDSIVPSRTSKQAKRRWTLMLKRIPDCREKSFQERLDFLVDNFLPGLRKEGAEAPAMSPEKGQHA